MSIKISLLWISLFLLLPGILLAQEAVFHVFLNTKDKGDCFLVLEDGDVRIQKDDLISLGFREEEIKRCRIEDGAISIKSLYPELLFRIDEKNACLYLFADLELFEKYSLDLLPKASTPIFYPQENSFFSNYRVNYSFSQDKSYHRLIGSNELFLRANDYLVSSNFSWDDKSITRGNTNIIKDFKEEMTRVSCGDLCASSGRLGGGRQVLGFAIKRDFTLQPDFVSHPLPSFSFAISKPSKIKCYLGNRLIAEESFPSGKIELLNLPVQGQESLRLSILDNEGVTKEIISDLDCTRKPRLRDYSLCLGSKKYGEKYKDFAGAFSYQVNLFQNTTGRIRTEADEKLVNLGAEFTSSLPYGNALNWGAAVSKSEGLSGAGYFCDYSVAFGRIGFVVNLGIYTPNYSNLSVGALDDKAKVDRKTSLWFSLGKFGRLFANSFTQKRYIKGEKGGISVNYSKYFSRGCLNISTSRADKNDVVSEVWLNLFFPISQNVSGGYNVNTRRGKTSEEFSLKTTSKIGPGFDTSIKRMPDGEVQRKLSLKVQNNYGNYYARYFDKKTDSYELSADGSVVFIGGIVPYLSRTINDGFVLVKVDGLKGVKLYQGGSTAGRTNNRGECLIAGLSSYTPNKLSLDLKGKELPIEYSVQKQTQYVLPPYRGGIKIDFGVVKIQVICGRIVIKGDGEKPIEFTTLVLYLPEKVDVPIGKNGEFYLENIPSGRYQAKVRYKENIYTCKIEIPESEEMFIDLGNVYATKNGIELKDNE